MRMLLFAVLIAVFTNVSAEADLVTTFRLDDGGTAAGSSFTTTQVGLVDNGVTFDVTLTVVGNGSSVAINNTGIGVDGTTLNVGESLTFSVVTSNASGGTVVFNGFTSLDFNSFSVAGPDAATFSTGDAIQNQTLELFDLTVLAGGAPVSFTITGTDGGGTTSFSLDDVAGSFTGVPAVPESDGLALALVVGVGMAVRRDRRTR